MCYQNIDFPGTYVDHGRIIFDNLLRSVMIFSDKYILFFTFFTKFIKFIRRNITKVYVCSVILNRNKCTFYAVLTYTTFVFHFVNKENQIVIKREKLD